MNEEYKLEFNMNEKYEQVREALLALMCIEDEINLIFTSPGACYHQIIKCHIQDLVDDGVVLREYNHVKHLFDEIEYYKGQLYIWGASKGYFRFRTEKRFNKIMQMVDEQESKK
jgi:hypothetical protein